jgi:hypothetical protein
MTSDNIIPVLAQVLQDDNTINAACYGHVTPGYPNALQDSKLTSVEPTAIWIRDFDKTEDSYIGSGSSGEYLYDILFQVDVMSIGSQDEAESLRRKCENLLKAARTKTYNLEIWGFGIKLQSRPATRYDDILSAWVAPLRMRAEGIYVAQ